MLSGKALSDSHVTRDHDDVSNTKMRKVKEKRTRCVLDGFEGKRSEVGELTFFGTRQKVKTQTEVTMNVINVVGNLLEFDVDLITQQANCLTTTSHGLAKTISQVAGVNIYAEREKSRRREEFDLAAQSCIGKPGSLLVRAWKPALAGRWKAKTNSEKKKAPMVVSLISQFGPSTPGRGRKWVNVANKLGVKDTAENREVWFNQSLEALVSWIRVVNSLHEKSPEDTRRVASAAFPFNIGCGLAGGKWSVYEKMIERFQHQVSALRVQVYIIKLPSQPTGK
jgi:hypothetical protein